MRCVIGTYVFASGRFMIRAMAPMVVRVSQVSCDRAISKPIIFHSDRGTQYNSQAFRDALTRHGIVQSMSGVGNCYDNAPMESLWARMKTELAFCMPFRDPDDAARHVYRYFHVYYNRKRRHSGIGNISPVEFEGRYFRSIRHSL